MNVTCEKCELCGVIVVVLFIEKFYDFIIERVSIILLLRRFKKYDVVTLKSYDFMI